MLSSQTIVERFEKKIAKVLLYSAKFLANFLFISEISTIIKLPDVDNSTNSSYLQRSNVFINPFLHFHKKNNPVLSFYLYLQQSPEQLAPSAIWIIVQSHALWHCFWNAHPWAEKKRPFKRLSINTNKKIKK